MGERGLVDLCTYAHMYMPESSGWSFIGALVVIFFQASSYCGASSFGLFPNDVENSSFRVFDMTCKSYGMRLREDREVGVLIRHCVHHTDV